MRIKKREDRYFGEILIRLGFIDEKKLTYALTIQSESQTRVLTGEILLEKGFITEEHVIQGLTTQYDIPFIPVGSYDIDRSLKDLIPQEFAQKHLIIPIEKRGNSLSVAMVNPLDKDVIEQIKKFSNCCVLIFISTTSDIKRQIEFLYRPQDQEPELEKSDEMNNRLTELLKDIPDKKSHVFESSSADEEYGRLIDKAKELFELGHYYSCVSMCQAAAEKAIRKIFLSRFIGKEKEFGLAIPGDKQVLSKFSGDLLCQFLKEYGIISDDSSAIFEHLEELRNKFENFQQWTTENDARLSMQYLGRLLSEMNELSASN